MASQADSTNGSRAMQLPLGVGQLHDTVVEAVDGDVTVLVVQGSQHAAQLGERVADRTAEGARVHVAGGAAHVELAVGHAAHAGADRRRLAGPHAGVGDHDDVAAQPVGPGRQQCREVRGAGLLLALDEHLEVDGRAGASGRREMGPDAEGVEAHLTLVVGRAPRVQPVTDDGRLERRVLPQVQRCDRLDVVVTVDQDRRRSGVVAGPLGEDGGQARRSPTPRPSGSRRRGGPAPGAPPTGVRRRGAPGRRRPTGCGATRPGRPPSPRRPRPRRRGRRSRCRSSCAAPYDRPRARRVGRCAWPPSTCSAAGRSPTGASAPPT